MPTIFFLTATQEKTELLILDLGPATKEVPCTVLTGRYVKPPHTLARAMGEIHWELLDSEYQGKPFSVPSRETKKQMKMGKNNPLTSPSPKAADALKFTRQGLLCSRQWGGEGGCSVRLPLLPRPAPRDRICMCNFGISIYLWMIVMQIFGTGSWVCSLALFGPPSEREGALCVVNSMP